MSAPVEGGYEGSRPLVPSLIRTPEQLAEAVEHVLKFDEFCVDVEVPQVPGYDFPSPKINQVTWVGIAVSDRVVLIPMGHTVGRMLEPARVDMIVPPNEEDRRVLVNGERSQAKTHRLHVPPVYADPGPQLTPDVVFEALRPVFFSDKLKIGHNLKFDLESVAKYYDGTIPPGPYLDTILLTHVLDENLLKYDLKGLVMDYLRVSKKPEVRKEFYPNLGKTVETEPIDMVAQYLAKDVWYCLLFSKAHRKFLARDPELVEALQVEMDLYGPLMEMELYGISIDVALLQERGDVLRDEQTQITQKIWDICGESFPVSNTNKRRHFLYDQDPGCQGLKPLSYTQKTNTPQLNQAVLEHYKDSNELASLFLEWSEKEKVIGTFIEGLQAKLIDGRLHTSFKQHGTKTNRLSSSSPNLQQIPRGTMIRDAFRADDGYSLVVADYDQVELRCASYLCQDPTMMKVFQEGQDIHAEAAAAMLQVPVDEVTKEQRQVGKTQNFGVLYGAGPDKVAVVAGVNKEKAEEFIDLYYQRFAGLMQWKMKVLKDARKSAKMGVKYQTPFTSIPPVGRRRRLPDLFSMDRMERSRAERQVVNSIVQGFAGYVNKYALIDLTQALQGTTGRIVLNVHDEVVVQAPDEDIEAIKKIVVATMEGVQYHGVPILGQVPLTAEANIAKRWSEAK